jgi:hypothetical protein
VWCRTRGNILDLGKTSFTDIWLLVFTAVVQGFCLLEYTCEIQPLTWVSALGEPKRMYMCALELQPVQS